LEYQCHPITSFFTLGSAVTPKTTNPLTKVNTRCVYYRNEELVDHHKDNMTLAPFIDMLNHAQVENVSVHREENDLLITALRNIKQGEEVVFSYHTESSRFWLAEYGFIPEENEFDDLDVTMEITAIVAGRQDWLEAEGYWGFTARFSGLTVGVTRSVRRARFHGE
jgi:hypothetical protein